MKGNVIGVDLGGTKIEACLMDAQRNILSRRRKFTEASRGLERVMDTIVEVIGEAAGDTPFDAVGMGTPGTYIANEDRLYGSPHTRLYEIRGFIGRLRERLQCPLLVENDANCLALAEFFSTCKGKYRFVMAVIMGTGFGCGLILNDKLYRGARGGAGEIGHSTIDFNGRQCECGRKGCAEAYLSGPSLSRRYSEINREMLSVREIYKRYTKGESEATELFDQSLVMMGNLLANAINTFDLEAVILGGGVSNLPFWYDRLGPYIRENLFGVPREEIPIIPAGLGDSAGVAGAAYLALRHLGLMDF